RGRRPDDLPAPASSRIGETWYRARTRGRRRTAALSRGRRSHLRATSGQHDQQPESSNDRCHEPSSISWRRMLAPPSRRSSPMKHNVWLSSLVVAFAACSGGAGSAPIPATASRAGAPAAGQAQQLKALYAEYWEENLKLNPI